MKDFEKACEENEIERDYELEQENAISFLKGSKTAIVTFTQGRFISKIYKLAEKYPDEVEIIAENKNKEGNVSSIVARIPTHYIKISNLKKDLSEEEREVLRERMRNNVLNATP